MSARLVIGSVRLSSKSTHVIKDNGTTTTNLWTADHGNHTLAVAMALDGTVYTGGAPVSTKSLRKYQPDGTQVTSGNWPTAISTYNITALTADPAGTYIIAGHETAGATGQCRKLSSDGSQTWQHTHNAALYAVARDSSDNVYYAGVRYVGGVTSTTKKLNSAGTQQWFANHNATVRGMTVDSSGNVYTVGVRTSNLTTRKYNSSGTLQWSADHGAQCNGVAVDSSGNVYTVGNLVSGVTTRKYDSSGTQVTSGNWPINHGDHVLGCVIIGDYLYTTGDASSTMTTRKYALDGTLIWSWAAGSQTYAIAGVPVVETYAPALAFPIRLAIPLATIAASTTTYAPALALPIALRVPLLITDRIDSPPALAFPLALRLPTLRLEHPQAHLYPDVYALELGGVLLPFSQITVRRNQGGLALTATIPSASPALLAAVSAHATDVLRVLRGPRLPDGSVQLDPLWTMPLADWSFSAGALTGSITLSAALAEPYRVSRTRVLRDVSYVHSGGVRQVRCRIDGYLAPGDVVTWPGQTLLITDMTYSIAPDQAVMQLGGF